MPITLTYSQPYDAPACAPGCILSIAGISGNSVAYFDPVDAGYSASRTPLFFSNGDKTSYTTQVLVSVLSFLLNCFGM